MLFPVAHGEGNYVADEDTLNRLEQEGRVAFRYAPGDNPNGSARNIAGILSEKRNVLGLMPHPERVCDPLLGGTDGVALVQEPDRNLVVIITVSVSPLYPICPRSTSPLWGGRRAQRSEHVGWGPPTRNRSRDFDLPARGR